LASEKATRVTRKVLWSLRTTSVLFFILLLALPIIAAPSLRLSFSRRIPKAIEDPSSDRSILGCDRSVVAAKDVDFFPMRNSCSSDPSSEFQKDDSSRIILLSCVLLIVPSLLPPPPSPVSNSLSVAVVVCCVILFLIFTLGLLRFVATGEAR